jgi:hypothetical protein
MNPPALLESNPSVSGETPVQFIRPVKLMFDACMAGREY